MIYARRLFPALAVSAILLGAAAPGFSQDEAEKAPPPKPCSTPEARQFDFWVGDWDLTWEGGKGTNTINAILGDCVIEENFDGRNAEGKGLVGQSYSVYLSQTGQWKQTWVDNQGSYLDFVGEMKDGKMILWRDAARGGKTFKQRMVFDNIAEDSLDWSWERSDDAGETWNPVWVIHYARRK